MMKSSIGHSASDWADENRGCELLSGASSEWCWRTCRTSARRTYKMQHSPNGRVSTILEKTYDLATSCTMERPLLKNKIPLPGGFEVRVFTRTTTGEKEWCAVFD